MRFSNPSAAAAVLLCGTAAASSGLQGPNLCPEIAPILPSECSPNADCTAVKCSLNWDNEFVFDVVATLKPCAAAASVGVELDLQKPVSDSWSHVWSLSDSGKFAVPGASVGIADVDVGLYAEGQIQVDADQARMTLAFDLCGTVFSYQYCGADLTYYVTSMKPYVPYVVMNHTFSLSSMCGSGSGVSGGGLRSSAVPARTADVQAVENGAGCCGDSCTSTSQCAEGMFCCPNHNMCMDVTTKGTIGPACDECKSA